MSAARMGCLVSVITSASGRMPLMESSEEGHETKGVGQVIRVLVTKQGQKAFDKSHLMNLSL